MGPRSLAWRICAAVRDNTLSANFGHEMEQPSAEVRLNSLFLLLRGRGALVPCFVECAIDSVAASYCVLVPSTFDCSAIKVSILSSTARGCSFYLYYPACTTCIDSPVLAAGRVLFPEAIDGLVSGLWATEQPCRCSFRSVRVKSGLVQALTTPALPQCACIKALSRMVTDGASLPVCCTNRLDPSS
jgi:hypothetical protein